MNKAKACKEELNNILLQDQTESIRKEDASQNGAPALPDLVQPTYLLNPAAHSLPGSDVILLEDQLGTHIAYALRYLSVVCMYTKVLNPKIVVKHIKMLFEARIASTRLLQLLDLVRRLLRQVYLACLLGPFPALSLSPGLAFCALPIRAQALLKSPHL